MMFQHIKSLVFVFYFQALTSNKFIVSYEHTQKDAISVTVKPKHLESPLLTGCPPLLC